MRIMVRLAFALIPLLSSAFAAASDVPSAQVRQALAPTGKLRVGLLQGNPMHIIPAAGTNASRGVGHDLGQELARRMSVSFAPVVYPSIGALLEAGKAGNWDVAFVGFSPARAKEWDFTAIHVEVEFGYLVPAKSSIVSLEDVDRTGVRVAVQEKSLPAAFLSRTLKAAVAVQAPSNPAALELMTAGKAEAVFGIKPVLFNLSTKVEGSRVLDGRPGIDPHAMAIPKGRDAGLTFARKFIDDAKAEGLVARAIERAGLRGVVTGSK